MALRVITSPVCEPITVAQAKLHARVSGTDEDDLFPILIAAARSHGESMTRRAFVQQTLELTLDAFPVRGGGIELPRPPFGEVVSIKYDDLDYAEQTLDPSTYTVLDASDSVPPKLFPAPNTLWPVASGVPGAVRIRYTAGYPIFAVPEDIVVWLLVRVTGLYEQRENFVLGTSGNAVVPMGRTFIDALLDPYTILEVV